MGDKVQFGTTVQAETVEAIERLRQVEGVTKGELIDMVVAAYDRTPAVVAEAEVPDDAKVVMDVPRDREMLKDCVLNLLVVAKPFVHENHVMGAIALARAEYLKGLPEYKSAERMREELGIRREAAGRPLSYTQKGVPLK